MSQKSKWYQGDFGCAVAVLVFVFILELPGIVRAIRGDKPDKRVDAIEQRLDKLEEKHHAGHQDDLPSGSH